MNASEHTTDNETAELNYDGGGVETITDSEVLDQAVDVFLSQSTVWQIQQLHNNPDQSINDLALYIFGDRAREDLREMYS